MALAAMCHDCTHLLAGLVRFAQYSPAHNPEGFLFNELLRAVPFTVEADLLSLTNTTGTFLNKCCCRGRYGLTQTDLG